jgi:hypothetical protein
MSAGREICNEREAFVPQNGHNLQDLTAVLGQLTSHLLNTRTNPASALSSDVPISARNWSSPAAWLQSRDVDAGWS